MKKNGIVSNEWHCLKRMALSQINATPQMNGIVSTEWHCLQWMKLYQQNCIVSNEWHCLNSYVDGIVSLSKFQLPKAISRDLEHVLNSQEHY